MSQKVTLTTVDGVQIIGDYEAGKSARTVILLHMMPATRTSWRPLVQKLTAVGFSTLAIDLRGHGESLKTIEGRILNYKNFSDEEQKAKIKDVEAAAAWLLREHGVGEEEISLVGASIGANLALQYLAEHKETSAAVLLSPGLVYRGLSVEPLLEFLRPTQAVFYVAAKDDAYSFETVEKLFSLTEITKESRNYVSGGHGTNLFASHPELIEEIAVWLKVHT